MVNINQAEILKQAIENGIIDIDDIQHQVEMQERQQFIDNHNYKVWQGKNGYYYTYIDKNGKRSQVRRRNLKDLENEIVKYGKLNKYLLLEELFYEWLNQKYEFKEITKQTYDRYVCDFNHYFEKTRKYRISTIDELKLEEMIKTAIRDYHLSQKGFTNYKIILKGIFKYAKKRGMTDISITSFLGDLEISRKTIRKIAVDDHNEVFILKPMTVNRPEY